jgi:hypothetical protein
VNFLGVVVDQLLHIGFNDFDSRKKLVCRGGRRSHGFKAHALAGRAGLRDGRSATPHRPTRGLPHADPEAELNDAGRRLRRGLPPGRRAAGLRQVDGMPRELRCGLAEQTRREHLPVAVTPRDGRAGTPRSTGTARHHPSAGESPRPRSGRRGRRFQILSPRRQTRPG